MEGSLKVWKRATKAMVEKAAINDKEMMIFHTGVVSKLNTTYISNGHLLGMRYRVALESNGKEFRKLLHIHWNDGLENYCLLLGKNLHELKKKRCWSYTDCLGYVSWHTKWKMRTWKSNYGNFARNCYTSNNVNEGIGAVLFFYEKISHRQKAQRA